MKKITNLILLLACATAFAQPILTAADINTLNFANNRFYTNNTTLNPDLAGANVTWDFSSLTSLTAAEDNPYTVVTVASGPFSSSFPTSNYVLQIYSDTYGYYLLSSDKVEILGFSFNDQIDGTYTNPETLFVFPFTYGMSNVDTFQESASTPIVTKTSTYDAYGTLITPFGTFTDVMRIKQEFSSSTSVNYEFIKLNPYQEILSVETSLGNPSYFSFYQSIPLAVEVLKKNNLSIFPNPASSIVYLQTQNNAIFNKIVIIDLTGKKVLEQNNANQVDIANLAKGLYVIEAFFGENKFQTKFIKE